MRINSRPQTDYERWMKHHGLDAALHDKPQYDQRQRGNTEKASSSGEVQGLMRAEQLKVPSEQHRIITHQSIRTGKLHTQDILAPTACWAVAVVILVIALVLIRIRAARVMRTPLP